MAKVTAPPSPTYSVAEGERRRKMAALRDKAVWTPEERDSAIRLLLAAEVARGS